MVQTPELQSEGFRPELLISQEPHVAIAHLKCGWWELRRTVSVIYKPDFWNLVRKNIKYLNIFFKKLITRWNMLYMFG